MTKKFLTRVTSTVIAMVMLVSAFGGISVFAEREYAAELSINGATVDFKNEPYSKFNTVFVPLEELCGYIGIDIARDGNTYTLKRMRDTLTMDVENIVININGKTVLLKNGLTERDGVAYAPVDIFSEAFKCPVTLSEDFRSADMQPNVYSVAINQDNAAAISAALPDKDTLVVSSDGADQLFYKPEESPEKEIAVFYKADLSDFADKKIASASLNLHVARGTNLNQHIAVQRTKPWNKGELNFANQPAFYEGQQVDLAIPSELLQSARNWGDMQFNITSLVNNAIGDGEPLAVKLLGIPFRNQKNPGTPQAHVKGVNTTTPPYIAIEVDENYTFPVKKVKTESVDDNKFSELQLLRSMGVFTEEDEFPLDMNESVTRGEFLTYAMRLRGSDIPTGSSEQFFSDVPTDSGYFAVTSSAYALGYIAGWEGIAFRPYDAITMGEAITILGRMLNYNIYADERGGFTPGYFAAAKYGDLYIGVNDNTTPVSFNQMIDLMENALDAKMLDVVRYTSDGKAEYIFNEDMTVLTEFWDAQKIEGVVTANEYGTIIPGENGKEGKIAIDGKELTLNYEPYNRYLGYKVKGYYSRTEDVLLYIGTVVTGSVTEVKLSDIEAVSETASAVSFSYMKNSGNRANESFLKNATVIYNGKSVAANNVTAELLQADSGSITLAGNDLVIINAYRTVVVFGTDLNEEMIYDLYEEYDNTVRLKNKDWSLKNTEGKKLDLADLQKYDVISVAESVDGEYITGIVERKTISGTITLIEDAGTVDEILTINGIEYETANRNEDWTKLVMLGADGKFFIDSEGSVVGFIPTQTTDVLGYVIKMDYSGKSSLRNNLQAAIMVQGNEDYVLYELADKVKLDGEKEDDPEDILAYFSKKVTNGQGDEITEFEPQGIIFSLNSDKKISVIDTYKLGDDEDEDNSLRRMANADEELRVKSSGKFSDKFFWSYSTALFVVSTDDTGDIDSYMTITAGISNDEKIWPEVYTMGKNNPDAAIVALINYTPGTSADSNYFVADRIVTAYDEEGYEVKKLYYHTAPGEIKSVIVPDDKLQLLETPSYDDGGNLVSGNDKTVNGVSRGDIIKIGTDAVGELSALVEYFDYEAKTYANLNTSFTSSDRYYGGYTTLINGTNIKFAPDLDTMDTSYYWVKNSEITNFYRYEVNNAGVELFSATLNDIRPYDKVPYNPTGLLLQASYARIEGTNFLVDMNQPAGTGIYSLKYEPNLPEGVSESDLSAFPEGIERYNPAYIATAKDKGSVTLKDYEFIGWTNKLTGQEIEPGGEVYMNENVVLQARWIANPSIEFTFTDAENPSMKFTMPYQQYSFATGSQQQVYQALPSAEVAGNAVNNFKKQGYVLIGWEGEDGTRYMLNNTASPEDELYMVPGEAETFKAIWMPRWSGNAAETAPSVSVINGKNYYQLYSGEDLAKFAQLVNGSETSANAILMNDIYLNSYTNAEGEIDLAGWYNNTANVDGAKKWDSYMITTYSGTFDGNGHSIYGLYIAPSSAQGTYTGMFKQVDGATIKNLNLQAPYMVSNVTNSSSRYTGLLIGGMTGNASTIENVDIVGGKFTAIANATIHSFGSIAGTINTPSGETKVANCDSSITIDATGAAQYSYTSSTTNMGIGGIVGKAKGASGKTIVIDKCSFTGYINVPGTLAVGAIIGRGADSGTAYVTIKNCFGASTASAATTVHSGIDCIYGIAKNATIESNNTVSCTQQSAQ